MYNGPPIDNNKLRSCSVDGVANNSQVCSGG
jgi:hypothetical protein